MTKTRRQRIERLKQEWQRQQVRYSFSFADIERCSGRCTNGAFISFKHVPTGIVRTQEGLKGMKTHLVERRLLSELSEAVLARRSATTVRD